jgi:hypothetical protein
MIEAGTIVTDPDGNEWTVKEVLPGDYGFILSRMVEVTEHARPDLIGPHSKYRLQETTA